MNLCTLLRVRLGDRGALIRGAVKKIYFEIDLERGA